MTRYLSRASLLVLLLSTVFAAAAFADSATNASSGLTLKGPGLAVHGYDVVAYFTTGEPTIGRAKHSAVHQDATYRFASAAHLKTFKKNPTKYAPQFGGYCAYGVSVGAKFDGDPQLWKIVDGKLYFNLNEDIKATWSKDIPGNIEKATKKWQGIANKAPTDLK